MQIQNFNFKNLTIRIAIKNGDPWFVAADVCAALEHSNSSAAISRLDDDEKGITNVYTLGGHQGMAVINESGLYGLILNSRKPQAKAFKKWVRSDVLPSIRKTGSYSGTSTKPVKTQNGQIESYRRARATALEIDNAKQLKALLPNLGEASIHSFLATRINAMDSSLVIALPKLESRLYSATEIGKLVGRSAVAIGRLATANNIKREEYGAFVLSKSQHCSKQVDQFLYNEKGKEILIRLVMGDLH
jgi:prophage antirepressor-like protein